MSESADIWCIMSVRVHSACVLDAQSEKVMRGG